MRLYLWKIVEDGSLMKVLERRHRLSEKLLGLELLYVTQSLTLARMGEYRHVLDLIYQMQCLFASDAELEERLFMLLERMVQEDQAEPGAETSGVQ